MNTIIMNQDVLKSAISRRDNRSELPLSSRLNEIVHTPAFIKADASNKTDNISQASPPLRLDTLHRTRLPAFHRYRCHLAYLEDSNATGRNCRLCHCRFSDTTLYSQGNPKSDNYAAEHSLLAGDSLCHPALRALRSTAL